MELFNSLTKKVEPFTPLKEGEVRIYSCGPTVYERAHIGNLLSFIYADTLHRALVADGYKVKHVMNITDVDDKTIAKSRQEYPELEPMEALKKLTAKYEKLFMDDLRAVGVDAEDYVFVRATDNIPAMQALIKELLAASVAYVADDGVYFSIKSYKAKGKTYGQLVDVSPDSTKESRIDNDDYDKDNAHDFALWKLQKEGEPAWDFEVDGQNLKGRPGWHIECSAMSAGELGQPFDIHTGGVDLKFPHHENEIAQSTAANGDLLAKLFFHNEHMLVDGQKMAKSLNNFYTLEDVSAKGYDPLAFRLLVLQSHYRNQAHFSWENLEAAQNRLRKLVMNAAGKTPKKDKDTTVLDALKRDLDTPTLLAGIEGAAGDLATLDDVLSLGLADQKDLTEDQNQQIQAREAARKTGDWQKADDIREQLESQGIGINDTDSGPVWYRL